MKSIFAGVGLIAVILFLVTAFGSGNLRASWDQWFNQPSCQNQPSYQSSYPSAYDQGQPQVPPQYAGACDTCDQAQPVPVPYQRAPFEYASSSYAPYQRIYVQPVYRSVWRYNRYEQVLVTPGYYRAVSPRAKEKRISFDIAGFLGAFRR